MDMMKKSDFWYDLPEELIAQTPMEPRDHSRMMVLGRGDHSIAHRHFYDLLELLREGDVLILNNSRVLPARLYGNKAETGGRMEFLLLEQKGPDTWEILVHPGKKAKIGSEFVFGNGLLRAKILDILEGGNRLAQFFYEGNFYNILDEIGNMPLPHYITAQLQDKERYQTVYSKTPGSAAAPTAGLHFTQEMLGALREKGVQIGYVTLHVGLGTFRPVKADDITQHEMHSEHYVLPEETARMIQSAKAQGRRVIGVGTTSCRTLESVAAKYGEIRPDEGHTNIFIYPGYQFRVLDGLITNFHLPESTLIMLVSAFAGYDFTMEAYHTAVRERYRFYSFGDAMMIL